MPHCGSYDGTPRTIRRTGRGLSCRSCLLFISLSSICERKRNDAIPLSFLSSCPLLRVLPCLRSSINLPPSGLWDVRVASLIAWRASLSDCLLVADLPVSPRRCRLVGRVGERTVFVPRFRHGWRPRARLVVLSRGHGSCPWRLDSMSCPLVSPICCLPLLVSSCVSFFISGGVSSCLPCLRCVFLVYFSPRSCEACACSIRPRARLAVRLAVPSRRASRAAADRHVLLA